MNSKNIFIYEEFHPNHKLDIEDSAKKFLKHWFEKSFDEYSWELNDPFILSDGATISKELVAAVISINILHHVFQC